MNISVTNGEYSIIGSGTAYTFNKDSKTLKITAVFDKTSELKINILFIDDEGEQTLKGRTENGEIFIECINFKDSTGV